MERPCWSTRLRSGVTASVVKMSRFGVASGSCPGATGIRQSWQKRLDISLVKNTRINERVNLKFSFDVFNVTNTPSFDVPIDDVTQNQYYNPFPVQGTTPLPTGCGTPNETSGFYNCPFGLGSVNKTIGSARQIQMSLSLKF